MTLVTSSALAIQFHHVSAGALSNPGLTAVNLQRCRIVLAPFRKGLLELSERQTWKQHPENQRRCRWWKLTGPLLPNDKCVAPVMPGCVTREHLTLTWLGKGGTSPALSKGNTCGNTNWGQKDKGTTNNILLEVYYQKMLQSKAMLVCWGFYNLHPPGTGQFHLQQKTTQRATHHTQWCCSGYSLDPSYTSVHFDVWLLREYFFHSKTKRFCKQTSSFFSCSEILGKKQEGQRQAVPTELGMGFSWVQQNKDLSYLSIPEVQRRQVNVQC